MAFGLSGAAIGGIAAGVGAIGGAMISANGAQSAADAQAGASQAGIAEQRREFDTIRGLLSPYVNAGTGALPGYNAAIGRYTNSLDQLDNLTGANGQTAQKAAIAGLTSSPLYTTAMDLGQQSILANASATGGLRGGNTIASLGFLPQQVLSQVLQTQIGNLGASMQGAQSLAGLHGGLLNLGENAAAGTGQAAMSTGNNITSLLGQQGAAQAGGIIGNSNAVSGAINGVAGAFGQYMNSSRRPSYSFAAPAYMNAGGISTNGSSTGLFNTPLFN
ncbi:hypothetical protein [Ralstonia insidiosa]|uniref:DNA transfer protein n=1 Tax=Ralstonia insidiosa TaxID=190721 RepID=A0A848NU96_9RALS|nr:hypothetical protein [Ralstonia insidiosa]NMV36919.1 hypothetical protein [Ralstonia insidiosa]